MSLPLLDGRYERAEAGSVPDRVQIAICRRGLRAVTVLQCLFEGIQRPFGVPGKRAHHRGMIKHFRVVARKGEGAGDVRLRRLPFAELRFPERQAGQDGGVVGIDRERLFVEPDGLPPFLARSVRAIGAGRSASPTLPRSVPSLGAAAAAR